MGENSFNGNFDLCNMLAVLRRMGWVVIGNAGSYFWLPALVTLVSSDLAPY